MTRDEFAKWGKHHQAIFPDFAVWWNNLKATDRESTSTLAEQWFAILGRVNLPDAIEASNRMLAGRIELCPAYERSMLASRIAAAAREIAAERVEKPREHQTKYRASRTSDGLSAGAIYAACCARAEAGEDPTAVARELVAQIPPDTDGPRIGCVRCLDTGHVWVWSNHSVAVLMAGKSLKLSDRRIMTVACDCFRGASLCIADDATRPKAWSGWRELARYSPDRYCRCKNADVDSQAAIAEFEEWVQDYAKARTRNMPNYSPALAAWSGG